MNYLPATRPTLYFIGVSTGQSSIMKIFPRWAEFLSISGAVIKGIDFPLGAPPAAYREAVEFIKADPLSMGALVTTHKIDLFRACRDLFDEVDPYAESMGEASSLSKKNGKLLGHAKDPISSGLALEGFLPLAHWQRTGAEAFVMGAGGAAIAITWHLIRLDHGTNRPARIIVSDRSGTRLEELGRIHDGSDLPIERVLVKEVHDNDEILAGLRPESLIVNATGLGKDAPGSPLSDAAEFPERGIAWELNYRGELLFLRQAKAQQSARSLRLEDGWTYFIHGWTQVIAEVFQLSLPTSSESFERLCEIAAEAGKPPGGI